MADVAYWQIVLQKSASIALWSSDRLCERRYGLYDLVDPGTFLLGGREMGKVGWRRMCDQLCQAPEILGDCRQRELVLCATRAS
jgi:hypothetical protein